MKSAVYIIIPLLVFVVVGELVAFSLLKASHPDISPRTILGSSIDTSLVVKLCENYHIDAKELMQRPQKPRAVQQCGKMYRINPPLESPAAPYKMVNGKGEVVAVCGGTEFLTDIAAFEQRECEASCSLENLCSTR